MMEPTNRIYEIKFKIEDWNDPKEGLGFVGDYVRKEALEKIRYIFNDYNVSKIECKRLK